MIFSASSPPHILYIPALVGGCGARALKRVRLLITFAPPNYTAPRRAV